MEPVDPLQNVLAEMKAQRAELDEDIRALERVIARRSGRAVAAETPTPTHKNGDQRAAKAAGPGDARKAILDLLSDGQVWTPSKIAQQRGTSPNAATRALKRMLKEPSPPIRHLGRARYKLVSAKGETQGSLPTLAGRED